MFRGKILKKSSAEGGVIIDNDTIVNPKDKPKEGWRTLVNEETGVDGRGHNAKVAKGRGEQLKPFTASLTEAIQATTQFDNKLITSSISAREARWDVHVQMFRERGLKIGVADIGAGEVVVSGSSEDEDQAEGGNLGNSRKHTMEVNAPFLRVAIGNKATLELLNAAITIAFDGKDHVTAQDVGRRREITKAMKLKGADLEERTEFFLNGVTPIGSFGGRQSLLVGTRYDEVPHL